MKRSGVCCRGFWVGLLLALLPFRPGAAQVLAAGECPWPEWEGAAFSVGGSWDDALPGWRTTPNGAGSLCLALERGVGRGVVLALWHRGAVTVELLDVAGETLGVTPAGEKLAAGGGFVWGLHELPPATPAAALLLSGAGETLEIVAALLLEPAAATAVSGDGDAAPLLEEPPRLLRASPAASAWQPAGAAALAALPAPAPRASDATPAGGAGEAAAALPTRTAAMPRLTLLSPAPGARLLW